MPKRRMGDIVVLLPGILGSVLARDGKDVWAVNAGATLRALASLGNSIKHLQLHDDPPDVADPRRRCHRPALDARPSPVPGLWKIDGYSKCKPASLRRTTLEEGMNYFPFPYDWRRDNRVHAQRLARRERCWLAEWRQRSGNDDAKLILIGHSMGGLVPRHFLEPSDGWRNTRPSSRSVRRTGGR